MTYAAVQNIKVSDERMRALLAELRYALNQMSSRDVALLGAALPARDFVAAVYRRGARCWTQSNSGDEGRSRLGSA